MAEERISKIKDRAIEIILQEKEKKNFKVNYGKISSGLIHHMCFYPRLRGDETWYRKNNGQNISKFGETHK